MTLLRKSFLLAALLVMLSGCATTPAVLAPGDIFRDCRACPSMVVVPAGRYEMGDLSGDGDKDEAPVHTVTVDYMFAVGRFEVTFAEWAACASAGGCSAYEPSDEGFGRGDRPVIGVSAKDADRYVAWLRKLTGRNYRLLSEAEFEYVVRAGTRTAFSWGDAPGSGNAVCAGCGSRWDANSTAPVGSFAPNAFGLYDGHGNVHEWTDDCWNRTYAGAPADGSAWRWGDCRRRVIRSGAWDLSPYNMRSASRAGLAEVARGANVGMRVARDL